MSENILGEGAAKHRVEDLSDVQVDSYERGGHVVGLVLWQGKSPEPFLCLKVSELGRMGRFALVSNDDVPEHDKHRALLFSRVVLRTAGEGPGGAIEGLEVYSEGKAAPAISLGMVDGLVEAQLPEERVYERQRG